MDAADGREEEKVYEEAMVPMPAAGINPRAVVVHLHYTPEENQ